MVRVEELVSQTCLETEKIKIDFENLADLALSLYPWFLVVISVIRVVPMYLSRSFSFSCHGGFLYIVHYNSTVSG